MPNPSFMLAGGLGCFGIFPLLILIGISNAIATMLETSPWAVGGVILLCFFGLLALMETHLFDGYTQQTNK